MKNIFLSLFLILSSLYSYAQNGYSGVFLRVNDSATYVNSANTLAKHTADYADIWYSTASQLFWKWNGSAYELLSSGGGGSGDVVGPASSTNNVPALFDGTTGKLLKNSTPTGSGNPVLDNAPTITNGIVGTQSPGDNSTKAASTAYSDAAVALKLTNTAVINTFTADHTLALTDVAGGVSGLFGQVRMNITSTANNLTVPPNSTAAFQIGTEISVIQQGTGITTIVQGSGVTITPPAEGNLVSPGQGQPMVLKKTGTNTWDLYNGNAPSALTATDNSYIDLVLTGSPLISLLSPADIEVNLVPGATPGVAGNTAASAGDVGETVSSAVSTYTDFTTTATYQNITSISLTAGDWDIAAFFTYSSNSATITAASNSIFVISTTTASAAGATEGVNISYVPQAALLGTSRFSEAIAPYRVSLSATTTYYLNAQATFTLGNPQYAGAIRARRIR